MKRYKLSLLALVTALLTVVGAGPSSAISGGTDATEAYPFMGAYKTDYPLPPGAGGNGCGVTLIDPQWALTAAHCHKNNRAQNGSPIGWTVQIGSPDVTQGGEVAEVSRFFRLPAMGEAFWGKDMMLLRLATPVSATPIDVAAVSPAPGAAGRILGWGNTVKDGPPSYPQMLQEADVTVLASDACPTLDEGELCVGTGDGSDQGKAGNADSGGPLLVREGDTWAIAGVLTGPEEHNDAVAGLYTDVTRHTDWIRTVMEKHASIPDDVVDTGMGGFPALDGCESSIVRTSTSEDDDPAMLLTNGHCLPVVDRSFGIPGVGATLVDQPVDGSVSFTDPQGYLLTTAEIERLLLGTMTGTDVALYRLDESFEDLEAEGVTVLTLTTTPPQVGSTVTLKTTTPRTCTIEAVVPTLREGGYEQQDALRMASSPDCETYPGHSGAALVAADGVTVVGVNSTNNRDGLTCEIDNPCEIGPDGTTTVVTNQPYGQQVVGLSACLTEESELDLDAHGCAFVAAGDQRGIIPSPPDGAPVVTEETSVRAPAVRRV